MRSCRNNGRIRALTSRNADAHSSSVVSIEASDMIATSEPLMRHLSIQRTLLSATATLGGCGPLVEPGGRLIQAGVH